MYINSQCSNGTSVIIEVASVNNSIDFLINFYIHVINFNDSISMQLWNCMYMYVYKPCNLRPIKATLLILIQL